MTRRVCFRLAVFAATTATLGVIAAAPVSAASRHVHHHRHTRIVVEDDGFIPRRAVFPVPGFSEATNAASYLGGYVDGGISAPVSADPYEFPTRGYYKDGVSGRTLYGPGFEYYGNP